MSELKRDHWAIGIGLALAANAVNALLAGLLGLVADTLRAGDDVFLILLALPGLTQLVWILPLTFFLLRSGKKRTVWGLLVTAGIVFLLNGACWGTFVFALSGGM